MPIRAITFDFWRTLFRDANAEARQQLRYDALAQVTGANPESIREAFDKASAEFIRHHVEEQATLTPADCVQIVSEVLNIQIDAKTAKELAHKFGTAILEHSPVPIDGALDAVRAACAVRPVGVISDSGLSPGRSLRQLLERHGFTASFGYLAFSDEVGVSKPRERMFHVAAEGLGVKPWELLHIGDLEFTDVAGAHQVGAKAALFCGDNTRYRNETRADYVFDTWQEFIDALPEVLEGQLSDAAAEELP